MQSLSRCLFHYAAWYQFSWNIKGLNVTHGNELGNTCYNVTTNFGMYICIFFVKNMQSVWTLCQNLQYQMLILCGND